MGGYGSGRWADTRTKRTVEAYRWIDVRSWHRGGWLQPGKRFTTRWQGQNRQEVASIRVEVSAAHVLLLYRRQDRNGAWQSFREECPLLWSHCPYGGQRPWLGCPACGRRVALLYSSRPGFRCRRCLDLAYASSREDRETRLQRKVRKIHRRLGWDAAQWGDWWQTPERPKGMHSETYFRLFMEAHAAVMAFLETWEHKTQRVLRGFHKGAGEGR